MRLLALDPGYTQTAWVEYDTAQERPYRFAIEPNEVVLETIGKLWCDHLAVEMVACYGMAVGREVFETCVWIGRFVEAWKRTHPGEYTPVYRRDVKLALCGSSRAKDANVRQALLDRFGPGKELAVGRKASPGPLYGFKADLWAALGVAVTWADSREYAG